MAKKNSNEQEDIQDQPEEKVTCPICLGAGDRVRQRGNHSSIYRTSVCGRCGGCGKVLKSSLETEIAS